MDQIESDYPPTYPDKTDLLVVNDRGTLRPVRDPADWRIRRSHILASMELVLGEVPGDDRRVPPATEVLEETRRDGLVLRKIRFAVEKDDLLYAYLLKPEQVSGRAPAALCLHQTNSPLGKEEPVGLAGDPDRYFALELARRGYVTISPDYPGFGDYIVDPYARGYASVTMKAVWNHMRCVDLLQSLPEVDRGRIACIGHSLGCHNALFVAAFDEHIKATAVSAGFTAFHRYNQGNVRGWARRAYYMPRIESTYGLDPARMPFDFSEVLAAIAPRALFVNAPLRDSMSVDGVRECLAAAKPVFSLLGASDRLVAVHPDCEHDFPREQREMAYEFVDAALCLGGSSPRLKPSR